MTTPNTRVLLLNVEEAHEPALVDLRTALNEKYELTEFDRRQSEDYLSAEQTPEHEVIIVRQLARDGDFWKRVITKTKKEHPYAEIIVINTDDEHGQDTDVLRVLARHNRLRVGGGLFPCAGVYAIVETPGAISAGDRVALN